MCWPLARLEDKIASLNGQIAKFRKAMSIKNYEETVSCYTALQQGVNLYSNIRKVGMSSFCVCVCFFWGGGGGGGEGGFVIENYYFWPRLAFCKGIFSCVVQCCPCDGVCIVIEKYSSCVIGWFLVLYVAHKEHLCWDTLVATQKALDFPSFHPLSILTFLSSMKV